MALLAGAAEFFGGVFLAAGFLRPFAAQSSPSTLRSVQPEGLWWCVGGIAANVLIAAVTLGVMRRPERPAPESTAIPADAEVPARRAAEAA